MSTPELYVAGKRLDVVKRIGRGGEGEVFLLDGPTKRAVKVYSDSKRAEREAKVSAMIALGLAQSSSLVAFPTEIATNKSGRFAGFTMRLVEGFRPVHELYGPKSRKIQYPKADYRFLIRAAANTARAVGQVHSSPCVIGDLNHSGILVSSEATVALIDADSFQFQTSGKTYPCLVGVPDFTPPELQGRSLQGVTRTKAHDHFGLAVSIFQLLFMGRHPYAGRQKGSDLTLDQMIAQNLFAYTRTRSNGVSPPGVVATLNDFPQEIGDAFERAFGLSPERRPSATEWVGLLQGLESRLSRCANDPMHFYPSAAKGCPWCRMEGSTGMVLFLSPFVTKLNGASGAIGFDVEKAWATIKGVSLPALHNAMPRLPAFTPAPSEDAKKAKSSNGANKFVGVLIALAAAGLFAAMPEAWIFWVGGLIYAWFHFNRDSFDPAPWRMRFAEADKQLDDALDDWRKSAGLNNLLQLKADLESAVTEFKGLSSAKAQALGRLQTERRTRQLNEYLDRFLIRRASISGIGPAKTVTLASFGIETAADITRQTVMRIPGFGDATAGKLLAWRSIHEQRFVYNSSPLPTDVQAQAKVEAEFAAKASALAKKIAGGQLDLVQGANTLHTRLNSEVSSISDLAAYRAQLEADLAHLGVSKPAKAPRPAFVLKPAYQPPPFPTATTSPAPNRSGGVACPTCGGTMVRRMARRGRRSGKMFWGCARYPSCKGIRN